MHTQNRKLKKEQNSVLHRQVESLIAQHPKFGIYVQYAWIALCTCMVVKITLCVFGLLHKH